MEYLKAIYVGLSVPAMIFSIFWWVIFPKEIREIMSMKYIFNIAEWFMFFAIWIFNFITLLNIFILIYIW